MKRERKRTLTNKKADQLSFDFTSSIPIEIHIPRHDIFKLKKEFTWERRPGIQLVRN